MQNVTWNENVMAADENGNIGYWHPGLHPLRPTGYDERLPYPGTGEAEWRGLLDRRKTPYVINPRQGYLFNWNNVPSEGWTAGDSRGQRAAGRAATTASRLLKLLVGRVGARPELRRVARDRPHQRAPPPSSARSSASGCGRPAAARGAVAAAVLDTLLALGRQLPPHRRARDGAPGVAAWEEFKDRAEAIALFGCHARPGPGTVAGRQARHLARVRHLERRGVRAAALKPGALRLAAERDARRAGQAVRQRRPGRAGASRGGCTTSPPRAPAPRRSCPFFDRGTWQQSVGLGP